MTRQHLLFDEHDNCILCLDKFDRDMIKMRIMDYLESNPDGMLTHEDNTGDVINIYQCNKVGVPSRVVTKGNNDYFIPLEVIE